MKLEYFDGAKESKNIFERTDTYFNEESVHDQQILEELPNPIFGNMDASIGETQPATITLDQIGLTQIIEA